MPRENRTNERVSRYTFAKRWRLSRGVFEALERRTLLSSVDSFVLINADTDQPIQPLTAGAVLNLATLPPRLNVRAITDTPSVGSVRFQLDSNSHVEDTDPFALFGNKGNDYYAGTFSLGQHTLNGTPFTLDSAKGTAGDGLTVNFSVIRQSTIEVTSFTLINATTDQPIMTIANGDTVDLSLLPTKNLNIRANTTPATVGSVVLQLDSHRQIENGAPYALFGNNGSDFLDGSLTPGDHTLRARAHTGSWGSGTAGPETIINFKVVDALQILLDGEPIEDLANIELGNIADDASVRPVMSITNRSNQPVALNGQIVFGPHIEFETPSYSLEYLSGQYDLHEEIIGVDVGPVSAIYTFLEPGTTTTKTLLPSETISFEIVPQLTGTGGGSGSLVGTTIGITGTIGTFEDARIQLSAGAKIYPDGGTANFGTLTRRTFTVKNVGSQDLFLQKPTATGGFTVGQYVRTGTTIATDTIVLKSFQTAQFNVFRTLATGAGILTILNNNASDGKYILNLQKP